MAGDRVLTDEEISILRALQGHPYGLSVRRIQKHLSSEPYPVPSTYRIRNILRSRLTPYVSARKSGKKGRMRYILNVKPYLRPPRSHS